MFAVPAAEFTAQGTANILVNRFIPLWECPSTLLSDDGSQFCVQLAIAVYKLLRVHKLTTSAYHPSGNGGVERVNHTMAQMLAMVCNEHQNDWDAHLPHVEYAYNNSVSAATGLASNEVHIGRLPRLPLAVFDRSHGGVYQSLDRDHLAYCDLARERQQRAYELVREQHALTVARINGRNSTLSDALLGRPKYVAGGWVWIYNTAATTRQGLRKGADNKVLREKLSLNWTGPSRLLLLVPLRHTANPTDGLSGTSYYTLTSPRTCLALPLSLASLWFAANLAPTRTTPATCLDTFRPDSPNMFYTLSRPNRPHTTLLPRTLPHPQYCSTSPKSLDTSVCAVEAAPSPFCMKLTRTNSFDPHGNGNLTSKLSEVTSSLTEPLDQNNTSLTPANTNNCALTRPPAKSHAQKGNATSRIPTDSSRTMFTVPALWPTLYALEPPSGTTPLTVPGG